MVVVVTLNGTRGESGFGGSSAAPVFKIVTAEALRVGEVPKDLPEAIPNTLVAKNAADLNDLAVSDLERWNEDLLADARGRRGCRTLADEPVSSRSAGCRRRCSRAAQAEWAARSQFPRYDHARRARRSRRQRSVDPP